MKNQILLILLLTLFIPACQPQVQTIVETRVVEAVVMIEGKELAVTSVANGPAAANDQLARPRMIIRTGQITLQAEEPAVVQDTIAAIAIRQNGWVVNSDLRSVTNGEQANIAIRIPAAAYERTVAEIKGLEVTLMNESSTSQDVTAHYTDLNSQLENLAATADRVRSFLDDTDTVSEALRVNQELSRLEGEIELIKGQMQYYAESAAYSSIHIAINDNSVIEPIVRNSSWQASPIIKDAASALIATLQSTSGFLIWLIIYFLPVACLFGIPLYYLVRFARRRINSNRFAR